ncbi:MAG TPA: response regulator [Polyangiaceae bacterium]|jgi:signal transduction histidine kinase
MNRLGSIAVREATRIDDDGEGEAECHGSEVSSDDDSKPFADDGFGPMLPALGARSVQRRLMSSTESPPSSAGFNGPALVWVVDDSQLEREMARRMLGEHHEVEVFTDGHSMLERVATGSRPDVLVLDWHMPEMSGLEICRFLRQTHDEASLPILVLTATGGQDELLAGLAAGANDFVTKLFDPAELRLRVATLVRLRRIEQASRRAREAADEANRSKDVFLAMVSHELRTPLNSILGWARLLGEGNVDEATLRRGIQTIQRNAQIQVQLIEDILDTTRVVSGKLHLEIVSTDFAQIVRSAFDSARPAADARQLKLELDVAAGRYRMRGDIDRLQQAVANLLANAVKFTPPGGEIRVSLRHTPQLLEFSVTDTGKGIAPQFLPHVFERFRQEDDAVTRRHSGLGLGLALVRHIVAAHEGGVRAESQGEGKGATFTIWLPRNEAPRSATGDSDRPSPSPSSVESHALPVGKLIGLRILVVEDDEDARDLLVTVLSHQGAQVTQAGTCAEALARFEVAAPEVLLSDIGLPIEDGYHLIRALRARGHTAAELPAIALTAYARREDQRLALEAGFQAHVAKPVEPAELVAAVAEVAEVALRARRNR